MAKKKIFQISDALTEGLEETITAAHTYSGELRIDVIPLKKIEVDPENPRDLALTFEDVQTSVSETDENYARKIAEIDSLRTMAHSIRDQGIINPIVVYKHGDKYRLVAGERRTLASLLIGKQDIQAKILDSKPNDLKISLLQWIENIERSDLTLWERLRNLEKIVRLMALKKNVALDHITINDLSHIIGCSKPHAMNYRAVLFADDHLKELIRENKVKSIEKAALIAGIQSTDVKQFAIDACLGGASLKKLRVITEQKNHLARARQATTSNLRRGRQAASVNFGVTKNRHVAKVILDSIIRNDALAHVTTHLTPVDWNDYTSITETFKNLLKKLEELHV